VVGRYAAPALTLVVGWSWESLSSPTCTCTLCDVRWSRGPWHHDKFCCEYFDNQKQARRGTCGAVHVLAAQRGVVLFTKRYYNGFSWLGASKIGYRHPPGRPRSRDKFATLRSLSNVSMSEFYWSLPHRLGSVPPGEVTERTTDALPPTRRTSPPASPPTVEGAGRKAMIRWSSITQ